jgi:hypothetical protein
MVNIFVCSKSFIMFSEGLMEGECHVSCSVALHSFQYVSKFEWKCVLCQKGSDVDLVNYL